jgi:transposase
MVSQASAFSCGRSSQSSGCIQREPPGIQPADCATAAFANFLDKVVADGASAAVRWVMRKGSTADPWLTRMLNRKPPMLVIVALANKMARVVWALSARGGTYQAPAVAV